MSVEQIIFDSKTLSHPKSTLTLSIMTISMNNIMLNVIMLIVVKLCIAERS
jgi:hypothetical protein